MCLRSRHTPLEHPLYTPLALSYYYLTFSCVKRRYYTRIYNTQYLDLYTVCVHTLLGIVYTNIDIKSQYSFNYKQRCISHYIKNTIYCISCIIEDFLFIINNCTIISIVIILILLLLFIYRQITYQYRRYTLMISYFIIEK